MKYFFCVKSSVTRSTTHIFSSESWSDLDVDCDGGLDGARADPSLDCTFSMGRDRDRVGTGRAASLSQTLCERVRIKYRKFISIDTHALHSAKIVIQ